MYDNVSTIAYSTSLDKLIIIYTTISALGFAYKIYFIYKLYPNRYIPITTTLTAILMIIGSFLPYAPNGEDIISKLHVYASMICCISLLLHLFIFTKKLSINHIEIYNKIHVVFDMGLQFLILSFLLFTRVNGYLEIIYSIFVCTYLYLIEKNVKDIT